MGTFEFIQVSEHCKRYVTTYHQIGSKV